MASGIFLQKATEVEKRRKTWPSEDGLHKVVEMDDCVAGSQHYSESSVRDTCLLRPKLEQWDEKTFHVGSDLDALNLDWRKWCLFG